MKVNFLIDGFNLYHSTVSASYDLGLKGKGTKWLNIRSLCESNIFQFGEEAEITNIYYFSALATHLIKEDPSKIVRHKNYIKCLENTGLVTTLGQFKEKTRKYWISNNLSFNVTTHEEKKTDVAISVKIFEILYRNECDILAIMSGDTDILPAVNKASELFDTKSILFVFPYKRFNKELQNKYKQSFKINKKQYVKHQFSDQIILPSGEIIHKPDSW